MSDDELHAAAIELLEQLELALPGIESAIVMSTVHGVGYAGPKLDEAMERVRRALGRPSHRILA